MLTAVCFCVCVQWEVDSGSSPLKEDLSSHEHIQAWLRHRRLQHILQLGNLFHFLLLQEIEEVRHLFKSFSQHWECVRLAVELMFSRSISTLHN